MQALAERLKLSNAEGGAAEAVGAGAEDRAGRHGKRTGEEALPRRAAADRRPAAACAGFGAQHARSKSNDALIEAGGYSRLLKFAEEWKAPKFPLKGADLQAIGMPDGPEMGKLLKRLEEEWVEADFRLDGGALLERAARHLA